MSLHIQPPVILFPNNVSRIAVCLNINLIQRYPAPANDILASQQLPPSSHRLRIKLKFGLLDDAHLAGRAKLASRRHHCSLLTI